MFLRTCPLLSVLFLITPAPARADDAPSNDSIHAALAKTLPLLQKGATGHIQQRSCFACHQQALPLLALTTAQTRGLQAKEEDLRKQLDFIAAFLDKNRDNYLKGRGQGGQADTAGYALWTLELGAWKPDATTAAVAEYLLQRHKDSDHWGGTANRPPSEASAFTTNYLALRALKTFGTAEQKDRIAERVTKVRDWLRKTQAKDTEDRVFRLWALQVAAADEKEIKAAVAELLQAQRKDGGWSQLDTMDSDAYATGSALVALAQAGGLATDESVYQQGLKFLLQTQQEDGSWLVRSRSKPFQAYYETGFPHGKDQFISSAATGWAATALALALPMKKPAHLQTAVAQSDVLDPAQAKADPKEPILWYDIRPLGIEGKGWTETSAPFDRLPAKAEKLVRAPVWNLSRHAAGLAVRFGSAAPAIQARWTLTAARLEMPHMPATGVSGLDLYVKDDGTWKWLANGRPTKQTNQVVLVSGIPAGKREYLLYLPLYNGVSSVEIGIAKDQSLAKAAPRRPEQQKPIVFYGTSITQGGCASRPGMVHTAILGRRFDRPVINLGFSGNGKMEPEMAQLLAELDPAVYVLDCLPNLVAAETAERVEPFVRTLRKAHPRTPIVLVEDPTYAGSYLVSGRKQRVTDNRAALKKAYDRLVADKIEGLYYLPGDKLLGEDDEGTVDGVHPTDLGFLRQAGVFQTVLQPLVMASIKGKSR